MVDLDIRPIHFLEVDQPPQLLHLIQREMLNQIWFGNGANDTTRLVKLHLLNRPGCETLFPQPLVVIIYKLLQKWCGLYSEFADLDFLFEEVLFVIGLTGA